MSWDFTKLAQKLHLPDDLQMQLSRILPVPVNPFVEVDGESGADQLTTVTVAAGEIKEKSDYIQLGNESTDSQAYSTTIIIKKYPKDVRFGHFRTLASFSPIRYKIEIHPIVKDLANRSNERKLNRLEYAIKEAKNNNLIPDADIVKAYESLKKIVHQVDYTNNLAFEIWFIVTTWASSPEMLIRNVRSIKSFLSDDKVKFHSLSYQQIDAFKAGLSLGRISKGLGRDYPGRSVTSDPLSYLNPFVNGTVSDGRGIYFGNATRDNSFIHLDLNHGEESKNIAVLGASGKGKSAALKTLGQSLLEAGFRVIYLDLNGEYFKWCQKIGGSYIDQRASTGKYIEPMQIYEKISDLDDNPVDAMIARVTRTVSILADTTDETLLVACDQAILEVLKKYKIDRNNPETWYQTPLRISYWYEALSQMATPEAQDLRKRVFRFFEGSLRHLFGKSEALDLNSQLIVIRLANPKEEGDDARASLVKLNLALDTIWSSIKRDKLKGERFTAVILDEVQRATDNDIVNQFIKTLGTSIRHQNGLLVTASNIAKVYLGDDAPAGPLWVNSYIKMIFYLEDSEIKVLNETSAVPEPVIEAIQKSYNLNAYGKEMKFTFMLKVADRNWEQSRFILSDMELELYSTRGLKKTATS
ncbi:VirB4 family type IV secretion system protein [Desulfitobacterium sp. AusDCA]|uniref:VirB4 family type IV secretion system protein n=1 Tax=Desulfitobacterium sp. AusDCA TaxID=3240383 RepID=UPI003DA76CAB